MHRLHRIAHMAHAQTSRGRPRNRKDMYLGIRKMTVWIVRKLALLMTLGINRLSQISQPSTDYFTDITQLSAMNVQV